MSERDQNAAGHQGAGTDRPARDRHDDTNPGGRPVGTDTGASGAGASKWGTSPDPASSAPRHGENPAAGDTRSVALPAYPTPLQAPSGAGSNDSTGQYPGSSDDWDATAVHPTSQYPPSSDAGTTRQTTHYDSQYDSHYDSQHAPHQTSQYSPYSGAPYGTPGHEVTDNEVTDSERTDDRDRNAGRPGQPFTLSWKRRPDVLAGLLLVLAGVAAGVSLLLKWGPGSDSRGWDLLRRSFDELDDVGRFVDAGWWQPFVIILGGGVLFVLGLLALIPARSHRLVGVLALVVAALATFAMVVVANDVDWHVGDFAIGLWFAVAVAVLGLLGALKAMLTVPKPRI